MGDLSTDRLRLHNILTGYCENVYFQPPSNVSLKYPCIVYSVTGTDDPDYADNSIYRIAREFTLNYISKSPTDNVPTNLLMGLAYCRVETGFVQDNLYHTVLKIYY